MLVELQNIHKHYGATKANNGISASLRPGEIHGFLGENGAGKSTLMKILAGFVPRTKGEIIIDGVPTDYRTPGEASRMGIGMLYQDPLDFPTMSVLDNFSLGYADNLFSRRSTVQRDFERQKNSFSFALQTDTPVASLTLGERQQLEILRLMARGCKLLILDEPTTGLSEVQKKILFNALRELRSKGNIIAIVSHKMEEIASLCDRLTILRHGTVVGTGEKPFNTNLMLRQMFGLTPTTIATAQDDHCHGNVLMNINQICFHGGWTNLKESTVCIREGERIGLAGAAGSGQNVFLRIVAGMLPPTQGQVFIKNQPMAGKYQHDFYRMGVVFLPSGRLDEGLIPGLDIADHVLLNSKSKKFFIKRKPLIEEVKAHINRFHIIGEPTTLTEALSGGNQQRLLLSFLPETPRMLVLEHPTRGLDQESMVWAWQHLVSLCSDNTTILFSTTDLDEILNNSDRVLVFFEGAIVLDERTRDINAEILGQAIAGKI